mgnify:CR=1 FL=1
MSANELFRSGKLSEAIDALVGEVKANPLDSRRRIFLFELLCFAGEYDRAEKHLNVVSEGSKEAAMGALIYHSALHAERTRQKMFAENTAPLKHAAAPITCTRNGESFASFIDTDPRIGNSLEVFVAGSYSWISLRQIASIEVAPPKRLRDMLWVPAIIRPAADYREMELGEVLLPVLSPLSWKHSDDEVRLGRSTVWEESQEFGEIPFGQKLFQLGDLEIPILELGKVELTASPGESSAASA